MDEKDLDLAGRSFAIAVSAAMPVRPDTPIGLPRAFEKLEVDQANAEALLNARPTLTELVNILINSRDWCLFLAIRHPRGDMRPQFAELGDRFTESLAAIDERVGKPRLRVV